MQVEEFLERQLLNVSKPSWYTGGEFGSVEKDKNKVDIRYAFCFPDLYDVGMSHLGIKILYALLNRRADTWCERVFAPNVDMEQLLRQYQVPLYGLESHDPIKDFDFVGFTLQYELCYTNILTVLSLAQIPLLTEQRTDSDPIVMAGGPCASNPAPLNDFIDLFFIGDGEEYFDVLLDLYKETGKDREAFLKAASQIECMYVPKYHDPSRKVVRAMVQDVDKMFVPDQFVVPYSDVVHDRVMAEIMRGCVRGCRFCQAGMIYRPYRQKSPKNILDNIKKLYQNTGYDEVSLTSLSSSDYQKLPQLTDELLDFCIPRNINMALPSLRVDNFTEDILKKLQAVRKSGLTFAPEAGTQRLRDVINKNVTEEEIMHTARIAFEGGATSVKLYFMIELPTETDEDILGIGQTAQRIVDLFYSLPDRPKRKLTVTISLSTFVPKCFTPFQWEGQVPLEEIRRKQHLLIEAIGKNKHIKLNYHDGKTSVLEGVFARGDERLGKVLLTAWENGCKFDAWNEHFRFETWMQALAQHGLSVEEYATRKRDFEEVLPWDMIDIGVTKSFLRRECQRAYEEKTTPNCIEHCSGCGISKYCKGDVCH